MFALYKIQLFDGLAYSIWLRFTEQAFYRFLCEISAIPTDEM